MLRGAFFHDTDDDFHIHDEDDAPGGGTSGPAPDPWTLDNVELTTVGVDVGSSTSHLLFARLHLQRPQQVLSSRFVVVERQVLHRSPILLTPYRADGLIDTEQLERFVQQAYTDAGLSPDDVDTGAVILTGAALERANAQAVAELFAAQGGTFVCASAGHNLEGILAAHGSGAVARSRARAETLLHIDIGGGTTKLGLLSSGAVLGTAAVHVGGRLIAIDADGRIERIEPSARLLAASLGVPLELGAVLGQADRLRLAEALVEIVLEHLGGAAPSALGRAFLLTAPLDLDGQRPAAVTFSGGVAEYLYGRETRDYGDLGPELARAFQRAAAAGRLPARPVRLDEGIRATVLGASQFSVQVSGNTVCITDPDVLPLRNLPVVYAALGQGALDAEAVAAAIAHGFSRLDLVEGTSPAALALAWRGEPYYQHLRALADGIARALPRALRTGFPLVLALEADVGASLGGILREELDVQAPLVAIDGLELVELDYVDVGQLLQPANVVPVVVKSLAFGAAAVPAACPPGGSSYVADAR